MDQALRQRLKDLEIRALRLVDTRLMGEWASNVRGQGLDFRDLREYVPGDDVRRLDWKATARSGRAQLRNFNEERSQTIWLALDLSASMAGPKADLARELLAVLAWAAVRQGDRFAFAGFTDRLEIRRPPARGEAQLWAALEDVVSCVPGSARTSLAPLWDFFLHQEHGRATIIVVSDFAADPELRRLKALAARHDVLAFQVSAALPARAAAMLPLVDAESGQTAWVDLSSPRVRSDLEARERAARQKLGLALRSAGVWHAVFTAGSDFLPPLMDFFRRREAFQHV